MRRRTFDEMITYFIQTVSDMGIDRNYKIALLGMVIALSQKHDESVVEIVRCKDCKKREYCRTSTVWAVAPDDDWYCGDAERRSDETD